MSLTNPNTPVNQQDLQDFYHKLRPYMGGSFGAIANKFSKGDVYSTDEKMIGQWIDGKPLYQKTINTGMPSSEGVVHNISNLDKCVSMYGILLYTTDTYEPLPLIKTSSAYIRLQCTDTSVYVVQTGTFSNVEGSYVAIQYTKTTDSPISIGDDTDYSTEEKIIGTWIDGKPVWQKTLNLGSKTINTSWNDIDLGISSVADMIIKWDAMLYTSSDIYKIPHSADGSYYIGGVITSSKRLSCKAGTTRTGTLIVTVQYTKTTT